MQTANEVVLDKSIGHQIDELGYSNSVTAKIIAMLNRVDRDIVAQLTIQLDKMPASRFNVERLDNLLKSVYKLNADSFADIEKELNAELKDFTKYEVDYQQKLLADVQPVLLTAIAPSEVYAAAMARPFQGKLLKEWYAQLETSKQTAIRDAIRLGYVESEATSQIVKRIRGTKALNYKDGVLDITKRNAESIVLTAVAYTSSYAQQSVYDANSDIVAGLEYVSVLDLRTTPICQRLDGTFYAIGKARPAIPQHIRCRSRYVARIKSFRELGLDADEISATTRASLDGQVAKSLTYQTWLEKQSVARQNEVLGVTKGKLFRDGGLTVDRFVSRQGHVYTLDELKARDAEAFKQAGL